MYGSKKKEPLSVYREKIASLASVLFDTKGVMATTVDYAILYQLLVICFLNTL